MLSMIGKDRAALSMYPRDEHYYPTWKWKLAKTNNRHKSQAAKVNIQMTLTTYQYSE